MGPPLTSVDNASSIVAHRHPLCISIDMSVVHSGINSESFADLWSRASLSMLRTSLSMRLSTCHEFIRRIKQAMMPATMRQIFDALQSAATV